MWWPVHGHVQGCGAGHIWGRCDKSIILFSEQIKHNVGGDCGGGRGGKKGLN